MVITRTRWTAAVVVATAAAGALVFALAGAANAAGAPAGVSVGQAGSTTLVAVPGPLLITGTLHVGTATAIGQVPEAERGHIGGTTAALPAGS